MQIDTTAQCEREHCSQRQRIDALITAVKQQKLHVNLNLTNRTTISVADVNGAIHTHSIYSTGMKGALLGM